MPNIRVASRHGPRQNTARSARGGADAADAKERYGAVAFAVERHRRGEIRRAFSLYVSEEVVDHVMAHPERLHLGGERREVTMAIVKGHRGTVNRFIGDAIMAMWGAPVEDPEQAAHACRAACDMQRDIESLNADLVARGAAGPRGSRRRRWRCSRSGRPTRRPVDRVIVKGKSEPVEIFTPCGDAAVRDATVRAIEAYRARRLDESERAWREVLAHAPADGVARIYLDRLRAQANVPASAWKDAVELEKL